MERNDFEWGRLVSCVENLGKEITKLDGKLDQYVKDQVTRREFETTSLELRDIKLELRDIKTKQDKSSWVEKLFTVVVSALVSGAVAFLL